MSEEMNHFSMGLWLLGLAFAVAVSGSVIGLACARHGMAARHPAARMRWFLMGALSIGGVGIWLMHFVAMLGFALPGSPLRYSLTWTIISGLIAVIAVFAALYMLGNEFSWSRLLASGSLVGMGITVMHYTGMQAVQFQGQINYNTLLIALSLVIAVVGATAALWFMMAMGSTTLRFIAGPILGIAIVGMHYTGMAAVEIVRDTSAPAPVGLALFPFIFPVFVLGLLALAVPIVAIMTVRDREIARMDATSDDLAHEAREFADR
ncbi:signal protein [Rhodococcus sp. H36-A4]|uniref:MHYT domain-containing protein n=1 Tax=Rhodococcus sp. H36-A4 TaxID=3004353 RepID=UPI0022AE786E|nr:MHYT domain-containing protein [Rhodococcus sp. H36-A4]MCZ4080433.1 signal protein [Rhodococcus sp. H36-A4]